MMEIPYNSEVRPDTSVTNQTLGMWLFLASEVMLFGAMFSSYALLRSGAASWPDESSIVNARLAGVNTLVLIRSSVMILRGRSLLRADNVEGFRRFLAITAALGIAFPVIKSVEYHVEWVEGLRPSTVALKSKADLQVRLPPVT